MINYDASMTRQNSIALNEKVYSNCNKNLKLKKGHEQENKKISNEIIYKDVGMNEIIFMLLVHNVNQQRTSMEW